MREWKTLDLLVPSERANISLWKTHLRKETDPFPETSCFQIFRLPDDAESTKVFLRYETKSLPDFIAIFLFVHSAAQLNLAAHCA
jgi:hypothetical protein